MKFNWGTGIVIGMILFMGFIITLSTKMIGAKVDLVEANYYEKGIEHEQHMESVKAAKALSKPVIIDVNYTSELLELEFPKEFSNQAVKGTIVLFFPADKNKDQTQELRLNAQLKQTIPLTKMGKGIWKVKLQWTGDNKAYYYEKEIVI